MSSGEVKKNGEAAGREYPERPWPSVAVCVLKGDRVLVIKSANQPSQGFWSVPAGGVELGETIQDTAKREIGEECGIEIEPGRVFHVENLIVPDERGRIQFHYVVTYLVARHISGEAHPSSDALEVRWATRQELSSLDMKPAVRQNMLKAFELRCSSDEPVDIGTNTSK